MTADEFPLPPGHRMYYGGSGREWWVFGPNTQNEVGDYYHNGSYHEPSIFTEAERINRHWLVSRHNPLDIELAVDRGL